MTELLHDDTCSTCRAARLVARSRKRRQRQAMRVRWMVLLTVVVVIAMLNGVLGDGPTW